jgi:hypothetical protein
MSLEGGSITHAGLFISHAYDAFVLDFTEVMCTFVALILARHIKQ